MAINFVDRGTVAKYMLQRLALFLKDLADQYVEARNNTSALAFVRNKSS